MGLKKIEIGKGTREKNLILWDTERGSGRVSPDSLFTELKDVKDLSASGEVGSRGRVYLQQENGGREKELTMDRKFKVG